MSRTAPAVRRGTRCAAIGVAATTLLAVGAVPASAQSVSQDVVAATAATAVLLTVNLPGGDATRLILQLDPVTGAVTKVGSALTATADAEVIRGSIGGMAMGSGASSAMLPSPTEDSSDPAGAFNDGLAGTPLANLLRVNLLPSSAAVSTDPSSASDAAVASLGVGLPDDVADALAPLLDGLAGGIDMLLTTLAEQAGMPVSELCGGLTEAVEQLEAVTGPLQDALNMLPIPVPVQQIVDETALGAVCGLDQTLLALNAALQDALASLTGDAGVLGLNAVTSEQSITKVGGVVTSKATTTVAGLTLLGQQALLGAEVLRTTATAVAGGTAGSGSATLDSNVAAVRGGSVDPFAQVRATIEGIEDSFVGGGALPAELGTLFTDLFATLNAALAPIGVTVFALDSTPGAQLLESCPTLLTGLQTGTFAATDGVCSAAGTRGLGVSLSLPAALAGPLMITGPLVELQVVPTAAVANTQVVTAAPATPAQLPRTGAEAPLAALGAMLVLGVAVLRRRRLA